MDDAFAVQVRERLAEAARDRQRAAHIAAARGRAHHRRRRRQLGARLEGGVRDLRGHGPGVGVRVRGGELIGVPQRLPQGLEVIAQRFAVEELHGVPRHAVLHAFTDEPHDAGMAHAEERQDLAAQRAMVPGRGPTTVLSATTCPVST